MSEQEFVGYIQEPDVHDGVVVAATYRNNIFRSVFGRRTVSVVVLTYEQRLFVIAFRGVQSASITNVEGMMLYSLTEVSATPPYKKFVFVDWEENHDRHFEVVAKEISSVEMTEDFVSKEAIAHLRKLYPGKRS